MSVESGYTNSKFDRIRSNKSVRALTAVLASTATAACLSACKSNKSAPLPGQTPVARATPHNNPHSEEAVLQALNNPLHEASVHSIDLDSNISRELVLWMARHRPQHGNVYFITFDDRTIEQVSLDHGTAHTVNLPKKRFQVFNKYDTIVPGILSFNYEGTDCGYLANFDAKNPYQKNFGSNCQSNGSTRITINNFNTASVTSP